MPGFSPKIVARLIDQLRPAQFRGKARLLHRLSPHSGETSASIHRTIFHLDLEDYIQRSIYLGTFEPAETRLVTGYLQKGMTLVDVGANVGYFTALGAQIVGPDGRVAAFEPSPYAFGRLSAMVLENRFAHVDCVNAGLSNASGQLKLYLGKDSHNHSPTMVPHENTSETSVAVQVLDLEMERLGIERIDLLKIDVEGYEQKVLAGACRLLLERRIKAILCEFNEEWLNRAGSSGAQLEQLLTGVGFVEQRNEARHVGLENRFFCLG